MANKFKNMKKYIETGLVCCILVITSYHVSAQDKDFRWAFSFGINAIDTRTSAGVEDNWLKAHFSQPFNIKENWNVVPSTTYFGVTRYIGSGMVLGLSGTMNKLEHFVTYDTAQSTYVSTNPGNLIYYGIDTNLQYNFSGLLGYKSIQPLALVGVGYSILPNSNFGTVNTGAGLTIWFTRRFGLFIISKYNKSFGQRELLGKLNAPSFLQHSSGFIYKFGAKDKDKDGILDREDACPELAGLKQLNGCPDKDSDGVIDSEDQCPDLAGLKQFNGCVDSDGDEIIDGQDKCPSIKGPKENSGCPWSDTDGDGVIDIKDKCPNEIGIVSNNGCPEESLPQSVVEQYQEETKFIYFNSGKVTFRSEDVPTRIATIASILRNYPNLKFIIEGHTDSVGSDHDNLLLSKERADVVRNVLIISGMNPENLSTIGYGESRPIESNITTKGRAANRRIEIKLLKD